MATSVPINQRTVTIASMVDLFRSIEVDVDANRKSRDFPRDHKSPDDCRYAFRKILNEKSK
jgi:hypothetical protein